MRQLASFLLLTLVCTGAQAQTAATQSATTPAAASDNAVKSQAAPAAPAADATKAQPAPTNPAAAIPPASTGAAAATEPATPTVKTFPEVKGENVDPRIAAPALPKAKLTLIGGTVRTVDPIRNRMTVDIYGGKSKMDLIFDDRTKITRDGTEVTPMVIRKGDRVYLDTQKVRDKIFAKQVQIVTKFDSADLNGQVVSFDPKTREIELRDQLSARGFRFVVDNDAAITANGGKAATITDLQAGALVTAHFNAGQNGRGSIRDINILAAPGTEFTLYGTVNHLDLRSGTMAVQNKADDKAYEVKFSPSQFKVDDLGMGSEVAVTAKFDGQDYVAQSLNVTSTTEQPSTAKVESDRSDDPDADKDNAKKDKKDRKDKKDKKDKDKDKESKDESEPK